jgi:hypothetical protein
VKWTTQSRSPVNIRFNARLHFTAVLREEWAELRVTVALV